MDSPSSSVHARPRACRAPWVDEEASFALKALEAVGSSGDEDVDVHLPGERGERVVVRRRDHLLATEHSDPERGRMRQDQGERVVDVLMGTSRGMVEETRQRASGEDEWGRDGGTDLVRISSDDMDLGRNRTEVLVGLLVTHVARADDLLDLACNRSKHADNQGQ